MCSQCILSVVAYRHARPMPLSCWWGYACNSAAAGITPVCCGAAQMQACGEPPADIVEEMSSAIAADLPAGAAAAAGDDPLGFEGLDLPDVDLAQLPQELKNCPVQ